jgi:hypothetical protein
MTEELRLRDEQLATLTKSMQETLAGLDKSSRKQQDLDMLKDQIVEFQTAMDGFKIELKSQPPSDKRVYKGKLKLHKAALEEMKNQIEWKQTDSVRKDLVGDHQAKVVDYDSAGGLMKHGLEVDQESKDSLHRTVGKVAETLQVGKETANKLQQQTDQMGNMIDNLDSIEGTLNRSAKIIREMARRVATDKYMWVLIVLVFLAIVFIIFYKNYNSDANVNVPDTLKKR